MSRELSDDTRKTTLGLSPSQNEMLLAASSVMPISSYLSWFWATISASGWSMRSRSWLTLKMSAEVPSASHSVSGLVSSILSSSLIRISILLTEPRLASTSASWPMLDTSAALCLSR